MKKLLFVSFALAFAVACAPAAKADSFDFTFTDGAVSGSGTLTGVNEGGGVWQILTGSGVFNDGLSSGVINLVADPVYPSAALDPSNSFAYDDQLMLWNGPNQFIDQDGLYFTFGEIGLNLYQGGGGPGTDGWYESNGNGDPNGTFAITSYSLDPTEVPEPGSALLLATGLFALAGLALRRRIIPVQP